MTATEIVAIGVAFVGVLGTFLAGRAQVRIAKESPATVAEGYGRLVADLERRIERIQAELDDCLVKHTASDARIAHLETLIAGSP